MAWSTAGTSSACPSRPGTSCGRGRRGARHRLAPAFAAHRLGRRRRAQDHSHRDRPGGDGPPPRATDCAARRRGQRDAASAGPHPQAQPQAGRLRRGGRQAQGCDARRDREAAAADGVPGGHSRRAARGGPVRRRVHAGRLRQPAGLPGLRAAHLPDARLPGRARHGLSDRAGRQGGAPRRAGRVGERRRRLHVQRAGAGHGRALPHPRGGHRLQRQRLRQRAADAEEKKKEPQHPHPKTKPPTPKKGRGGGRGHGPPPQQAGRGAPGAGKGGGGGGGGGLGETPAPWKFVQLPRVRPRKARAYRTITAAAPIREERP